MENKNNVMTKKIQELKQEIEKYKRYEMESILDFEAYSNLLTKSNLNNQDKQYIGFKMNKMQSMEKYYHEKIKELAGTLFVFESMYKDFNKK